MSELTFACLLGNPKVRYMLRSATSEITWKSPLAQKVMDYFISERSDGSIPTIIEMRTFLSNICVEEEAKHVIDTVISFLAANDEQINFFLKDFEEFYQKRRLEDILNESEGDYKKVIDGIQGIKKLEVNNLPVEILGDMDVEKVIKQEMGDLSAIPSRFELIKAATPWGGYLRGQVVQVCAPPGCGKSLFLANETVMALYNGLQVYYAAFGDLMRLDFIIRMTSIVTGVKYTDVSLNPKKYFSDEVKSLMKGLRITVVPAGTVDILSFHDFVEFNVSKESGIDLLVVDYDANLLALNEESMYGEGNTTYNTLSRLARPTHSKYRLVLVASQPKIQYWNLEELPKECSAESSRKQAIIDLMVTLGRAYEIRNYHSGIMKIAKARRGSEGLITPYRVTDCGLIDEIGREEYSMMKTYQKGQQKS